MGWHKAGLITLQNNKTSVTGVNTYFQENVKPGFCLYAPDGKIYEILSIQDNSTLTLAKPYTGANATDAQYGIWQTQGEIVDLATKVSELLNSFGPLRDSTDIIENVPAQVKQYRDDAAASATIATTKAQEAADAAASIAGSTQEAQDARDAAVAANTAAQTAKNQAISARNAAQTSEANAGSSATAAEDAKTAAETANDAAQTAKNQATTAKNQAQTANTAAQTAKTDALAAQTAAESARDTAVSAKNDALASQTDAAESRDAAAQSAADALASKNAAAGSATTATNAKNAAQSSATNAATSETNAANSASAANSSKTAAAGSASDALASKNAAQSAASIAAADKNTVAGYKDDAAASASSALASKNAAAGSAADALASKNAAKTSETNAATSAAQAIDAVTQLSATVFPKISPVFRTNFKRSSILDPRISFSRQTMDTVYDASGRIITVDVNKPSYEHDPVTGERLGLYNQMSLTNFTQWSEDLTKADPGVGPSASTEFDGTMFGDIPAVKFMRTSAGETEKVTTNFQTVAGARVCAEFIVKAGNTENFNITMRGGWASNWLRGQYSAVTGEQSGTTAGALSFEPGLKLADGFVRTRVWFTADVDATASVGIRLLDSSAVGDYIYVATRQVTFNRFGHYIRTTDSTAARTPDVVEIVGDDFKNIYNPTEGTIFIELLPEMLVDNQWAFNVEGDGLGQILGCYYNSNGNIVGRQATSTTTVVSTGGGGYVSPGEPLRIAMKYGSGQFTLVANGIVIGTNTCDMAALAQANKFVIGDVSTFSDPFQNCNCAMQSFSYYERELSDAAMQALTTP